MARLERIKLFDLMQLESRYEDSLHVYHEHGKFIRGTVKGKDWDEWHELLLGAVLDDDKDAFDEAANNMDTLYELMIAECGGE